jgi:cytochrome c peroxidase
MPRARQTLPLVVAITVAALVNTGCASRAPEPMSALPPIQEPADNPSTPAKVALGAQLFVDKRLSGSGQMACQSCHFRALGWTDGSPLSRRDDGQMNTRHSPSLYNVGHQSAWYWDGRATTLEGQVLAAWRGQTGADPVKVSALLNGIPGYATQFQAVYGGTATPETVSKSLAAYLRTLNSDNAPWDRYERGDTQAVSADAVAGQKLFAGKGGCIACHAPPLYGNSTFFNIGLEAGKAKPDPGRFNVTKLDADIGAFKTPSLRSVELKAPYFHDGSRASLTEAVRYMAGGGGDDPRKSPVLQPRGFSDAELAQVVAFLRTLTSTEPWQAPALP